MSSTFHVNNLLNNTYETFGTFAPNARRPGAPVERFLTPCLPYMSSPACATNS